MRASGISPEMSELDAALEEIIERKENGEEQQKKNQEESRQEVQKQKETAELVRKKAMESISQAPFTLYRYNFDPLYLCYGSNAFTLYRIKNGPFTLSLLHCTGSTLFPTYEHAHNGLRIACRE